VFVVPELTVKPSTVAVPVTARELRVPTLVMLVCAAVSTEPVKLPVTFPVMAPLAAIVVNEPVEAVVAPTLIPFIVPPVSVAPDEARVFKVAVLEAARVVNDPAYVAMFDPSALAKAKPPAVAPL
tara:strand:- start:314 stop:688 length:375 start_codon:yes stop_codon:yes gene_type:complete